MVKKFYKGDKVRCIDCGDYKGSEAKKFDKIEDFDLRRLIGLEVINVNDSETISKVREMSLWC